ncbi:unnamed protein product [Nezara viridula]|uniref:Uncharacterized protein n=1 Tax=Nezara viridula TaxID=85310 RepID=A0A9P0HDB3_NEZVI|nr:unnamed protein product [Nezara viridula]
MAEQCWSRPRHGQYIAPPSRRRHVLLVNMIGSSPLRAMSTRVSEQVEALSPSNEAGCIYMDPMPLNSSRNYRLHQRQLALAWESVRLSQLDPRVGKFFDLASVSFLVTF